VIEHIFYDARRRIKMERSEGRVGQERE